MPWSYNFAEEYYHLLQQKENVVLLESSRTDEHNTHSFLFTDPVQILQIHRVSELADLLAAISIYTQQGYYLAGYFAYECGYHIEKLGLFDYKSRAPLAWFGVYQQPIIFDHTNQNFVFHHDLAGKKGIHGLGNVHFDLNEATYREKIDKIKEYICAGDVYQVNFTGRYHFDFDGSPISLYRTLKKKQPVPYSAYIRAAGQDILCFSPELFFSIKGQQIMTRPMKGTTSRGRWPLEDDQRAQWLREDCKNRAENVMIVDLLRNDLGRLCQIGSVTVPKLFTVEKYETLFQMTSTVTGTLREKADYQQLFRSLFPCGSITGAPKIRAMEIIHELENSPRGIYTGSIGYFAPAEQGARAIFNVAIRTIVLENGHGEMGIGSGILADSSAKDEYAECALKAYFLTNPVRE